jgi:chromate transporter
VYALKQKFWKLFISTFRISACTFGGGFVIIPLMRRKFVEELGWIEEQEMLDLTAIAQSCPGAMAVNASILVGYRVAGIPGALITVLGTVLPPLVIISVISLFYQAFRDNAIVNLAMGGMLAYNGMTAQPQVFTGFVIGLVLAAYYAAMGLVCAAAKEK